MRRLPRDAFTLCSAVSLLVCVAAWSLARAADRASDASFNERLARSQAHLELFNEAIRRVDEYQAAHPGPTAVDLRRLNDLTAEVNRLGAEQNRLTGALVSSLPPRSPYLWATLAAAVLPSAWLMRWGFLRLTREQRLRDGLCPSCGYDLRASPGRCPECGAAAVSSP